MALVLSTGGLCWERVSFPARFLDFYANCAGQIIGPNGADRAATAPALRQASPSAGTKKKIFFGKLLFLARDTPRQSSGATASLSPPALKKNRRDCCCVWIGATAR